MSISHTQWECKANEREWMRMRGRRKERKIKIHLQHCACVDRDFTALLSAALCLLLSGTPVRWWGSEWNTQTATLHFIQFTFLSLSFMCITKDSCGQLVFVWVCLCVRVEGEREKCKLNNVPECIFCLASDKRERERQRKRVRTHLIHTEETSACAGESIDTIQVSLLSFSSPR